MDFRRKQSVPINPGALVSGSPFCQLFVLMIYFQAMTEAQAKKELVEDEKRRVEAGGTSLHSISASSFIIMGLDIEETQ